MLKNILKGLVVFVLGFILLSCGNKKEEVKSDVTKVKIGVVGSTSETWDYLKEVLIKENIELEIVKFSDYNQPNDALLNGDIDLNAFQHRIFLANYNKEKNANLTPIGDTVIAPIGLYSNKIKNVEGLVDGDTIIIPNDVTNQARAINLLVSAGLITLKADAEEFPTPKDVEGNPKNLNIVPVDASQTARSLQDVAAAVINNGVAVDSGLTPTVDAIFLEKIDEKSKPYINIIVAREEDKDNEVYKKIVKAFQTDEVKEIIDRISKGSSVTAW